MLKIEENLGIDLSINTFTPVLNKRSSCEELARIKAYSDENLAIINKSISTNQENEKRNFIVNLIAALDYYIHEIIIWGITQITLNNFPKGKKYDSFKISIKFLKEFNESADFFENNEIKKAIIEELQFKTYQKWKDIKDGLDIILPTEYNKKISSLANGNKDNKAIFQVSNLENLNVKRNLIVHHFDRDYKNQSIFNEIDFNCLESYELIKLLINSIHDIVFEYDNTFPENNK